MAVETIPKANVSAASAPASAPAAETPRETAPTPATPPASDTDTREPRRPKVDLCWPPPFTSAIPGIAQIRPICYHFQRFGGPEKD